MQTDEDVLRGLMVDGLAAMPRSTRRCCACSSRCCGDSVDAVFSAIERVDIDDLLASLPSKHARMILATRIEGLSIRCS